MKRFLVGGLSVVMGIVMAGRAEAFTSKQKSTIEVSASGVTETLTFSTAIVAQGTADTPATLGFGSGGNEFRDSGEAVKVTVDNNSAGNRLIIYTDNLGGSANPQACLNTALGNDGGGLVGVGVGNCDKIVPLLWSVADTNVDHAFTTGTIGDDEIFVTDLAHVATFTTVSGTLDNQAMERCSDDVDVPNTSGDGLYPQFFGGPGVDRDLCADGTNNKIGAAEELSKNIAVFGFGFFGTTGSIPDLSTPTGTDSVAATSPVYLPLGADFRNAAGGVNYSTNTITLELVTQ